LKLRKNDWAHLPKKKTVFARFGSFSFSHSKNQGTTNVKWWLNLVALPINKMKLTELQEIFCRNFDFTDNIKYTSLLRKLSICPTLRVRNVL
jgi:hypothetical protein